MFPKCFIKKKSSKTLGPLIESISFLKLEKLRGGDLFKFRQSGGSNTRASGTQPF